LLTLLLSLHHSAHTFFVSKYASAYPKTLLAFMLLVSTHFLYSLVKKQGYYKTERQNVRR